VFRPPRGEKKPGSVLGRRTKNWEFLLLSSCLKGKNLGGVEGGKKKGKGKKGGGTADVSKKGGEGARRRGKGKEAVI